MAVFAKGLSLRGKTKVVGGMGGRLFTLPFGYTYDHIESYSESICSVF